MATTPLTHVRLVSLLLLAATGCASPYMVDRTRDVRDCFTASLGTGLGVKVKAGPFQPALFTARDRVGLRASEVFTNGADLSYNTEWAVLVPLAWSYRDDRVIMGSGVECFIPEPANTAFLRGKDIDTRLPFPGVALGKVPSWTQLELAVGFGPMLRLGFNPVEMLDLLVGLVGWDLYGDDVNAQEQAILKARQDEIERMVRERHMLYRIRQNRKKAE